MSREMEVHLTPGVVVTGGHFVPMPPAELAAWRLYRAENAGGDIWYVMDEAKREHYRRMVAVGITVERLDWREAAERWRARPEAWSGGPTEGHPK